MHYKAEDIAHVTRAEHGRQMLRMVSNREIFGGPVYGTGEDGKRVIERRSRRAGD